MAISRVELKAYPLRISKPIIFSHSLVFDLLYNLARGRYLYGELFTLLLTVSVTELVTFLRQTKTDIMILF